MEGYSAIGGALRTERWRLPNNMVLDENGAVGRCGLFVLAVHLAQASVAALSLRRRMRSPGGKNGISFLE